MAGGRELGAGIAPEHEGAPDRKWRRVATDGEAGRGSSPGRLYHNTMEQAVGLLEWCARFVDGGGLLCYEPQRFLWWPRGRNQGRTRIVPPEVLGAFDRVQRALDGGRTRPGLADSVAGHPGDGIAGDASTSTGWGLVVGEWVFYGTWSAETLGACEEARRRRLPEEPDAVPLGEPVEADVEWSGEGAVRKVSISPLELVVQGFVVRAVRMTRGGELPNGCLRRSAAMVSGVGRETGENGRGPAGWQKGRIWPRSRPLSR